MIQTQPTLIHWNYFLALENDLAHLSRFVEFHEDNFETYSIEMAHLLFGASSEVDVVLALLCQKLKGEPRRNGINIYKSIILSSLPEIATTQVTIPRFGIVLTPFDNWHGTDKNPNWWCAYNKVKHERDTHFPKANLKNVLNSIGALFIVLLYWYRDQTTENRLSPVPSLFRIDATFVKLLHTLGGETILCYEQ
jgi:hypothetical protein